MVVGDTLSITLDLTFDTTSSGLNVIVKVGIITDLDYTALLCNGSLPLSKLDIIYMKFQLEIRQN